MTEQDKEGVSTLMRIIKLGEIDQTTVLIHMGTCLGWKEVTQKSFLEFKKVQTSVIRHEFQVDNKEETIFAIFQSVCS